MPSINIQREFILCRTSRSNKSMHSLNKKLKNFSFASLLSFDFDLWYKFVKEAHGVKIVVEWIMCSWFLVGTRERDIYIISRNDSQTISFYNLSNLITACKIPGTNTLWDGGESHYKLCLIRLTVMFHRQAVLYWVSSFVLCLQTGERSRD